MNEMLNGQGRQGRVNPSAPRHKCRGLLRVNPERCSSFLPSKAGLSAAERVNLHRNCFACGANNGFGLGLKFYKNEDGTVFGNFFADQKFEGYSGIIHGGIVATLLDSAMTHCLLMKDIPALTGRLSIKYSIPIRTGTVVKLEARVVDQFHKTFILEGKALVDGRRVASAEAKYRTTKRMVNQGAKK